MVTDGHHSDVLLWKGMRMWLSCYLGKVPIYNLNIVTVKHRLNVLGGHKFVGQALHQVTKTNSSSPLPGDKPRSDPNLPP